MRGARRAGAPGWRPGAFFGTLPAVSETTLRIEAADNPAAQDATATCHLCGSPRLVHAPEYGAWHRVTSDCKPWPPGGSLARCPDCNLVQAAVTPRWHAEADAIYREYTIYHQGGGAEQTVFDGARATGVPRSEQILEALSASTEIPGRGRLLDVGCGNGSFLRAWSRRFPGWSLSGTEVSDKHRPELEQIPGFESLHTGRIESLPGGFDVISLVHVLEHVPSPVSFLRQLRERLVPGGKLLVQVPDCAENPYMLLVADHCSHFAPGLLAGAAAAAGFDDVRTHSWVKKEISLTAKAPPSSRDATRAPASAPVRLPRAEATQVFDGRRELARVLDRVLPLTRRPNFGLFGTAIAATWLDAQTAGAAVFFVDEDPNRVGKSHQGRPILAPADIPDGAILFVALPPVLAGAVGERLRALGRGIEVVVP